MTTERLLEKSTEHLNRMTDSTISTIRRQVPIGPSRVSTCECGEDICPERTQAGYEICIECAQEIELRQKRQAR